jgi:hypothetical protein
MNQYPRILPVVTHRIRRLKSVFAGAALLLAGAVLGFVHRGPASDDLRSKAARVTLGMTAAEVRALLGPPEISSYWVSPDGGRYPLVSYLQERPRRLWIEDCALLMVFLDGSGRVVRVDLEADPPWYVQTCEKFGF